MPLNPWGTPVPKTKIAKKTNLKLNDLAAGAATAVPAQGLGGVEDIDWKWNMNYAQDASLYECMERDKNMKKDSSMKHWLDLVQDYPKDQNYKTPLDERVCAVRGVLKNTLPSQWNWLNPYWVSHSGLEEFVQRFVECSQTQQWSRVSEMGKIYGGAHVRKTWLEANGYTVLKHPIFHNYWAKKDECFVFVQSEDEAKIDYLAPKGQEKNFPICSFIGKRFHGGELMHVHTPDGPIKVSHLAVSKKMGDIESCNHCTEYYIPPLIAPYKAAAGQPEQMLCEKCKNKAMEKDVIRHYDDNNFLPAMHDIVPTKLKGKTYAKETLRLFGVELEVGFNTGVRVQVALDVWDAMGRDFCYIKHDGSITKTQFDDGYKVKNPMKMGFEIVTAPAGIQTQRERWKNLSKAKNFKILRAWDADSCGLHVHVNRKSLTWLQIGRMLVFINHPNNRYFVEVVAGRNSNYYTRYIGKSFTDCGVVDESKYMALRTNKPDTIEFRIFRATVNYRHIIRDIEFAEAVCDFCAPCANSLQDIIDFRCFIRFVAQNKSSYPMLAEWLRTIDLIAKKPLTSRAPKMEALDEALSEAVKEQLAGVMMACASKEPLDKLVLTPKENKKPTTFEALAEDDDDNDPDPA